MNDLTQYRAVRDSMRPGDVVAFGGSGFVSDAIKFLTHSRISHVGVVFDRFEDSDRRVTIAESTSLNKISGVQFNLLSERLESYPGRAWWLPLSDRTRRQLDIRVMLRFLKLQDGEPYDFRGIMGFLARPIPGIGQIPFFHHGAARAFFCSEYVVAGYEAGGLPIGLEPDEVSPETLCRLPIFDKRVPLIG